MSVDKFGITLESQGYCTSKHWKAFTYTIVGWHFLLLGMALYLCYASRNISARFAEAKPLAVVMISQFQIFLISIPVLIIVGGQVLSSFFVRSAVIWLNDFGVILIVFGNLMYAVHWNNTLHLEVGAAVKEFSVRQRRDSEMSRFSSSVYGNNNDRTTRRVSSIFSSGGFSVNGSVISGTGHNSGNNNSSEFDNNDSGPLDSSIDSQKIMTYASTSLSFDDNYIMEEIDKDDIEATSTNSGEIALKE